MPNTIQNTSLNDYFGDEAISREPGDANVFISYHTEDESQVSLLRYHIQDERFGIEAEDYTVTTPYQSNWKVNVSVNNIMPVTHVLCYIGPETYEREAVSWEINEAHRQGKKVIGVRPQGSKYKIPNALKEHGDKVIDWDLNEISNELSSTN